MKNIKKYTNSSERVQLCDFAKSFCVCALILCMAGCAGFSSRLSGGEEPVRISKGPYQFHFAGFGTYQALRMAIEKRLSEKGMERSGDSKRVLQFVLLEKNTTSGALRLLNLLATAATALIIPFYNQANHTVEVRYYEEGIPSGICRYDLRVHELVGLIFLPLMPFYWPASEQEDLFLRSVDEALTSCLQPG